MLMGVLRSKFLMSDIVLSMVGVSLILMIVEFVVVGEILLFFIKDSMD